MDQAHTSMLNGHSLITENELAHITRTSVRVCIATTMFSLIVLTALKILTLCLSLQYSLYQHCSLEIHCSFLQVKKPYSWVASNSSIKPCTAPPNRPKGIVLCPASDESRNDCYEVPVSSFEKLVE